MKISATNTGASLKKSPTNNVALGSTVLGNTPSAVVGTILTTLATGSGTPPPAASQETGEVTPEEEAGKTSVGQNMEDSKMVLEQKEGEMVSSDDDVDEELGEDMKQSSSKNNTLVTTNNAEEYAEDDQKPAAKDAKSTPTKKEAAKQTSASDNKKDSVSSDSLGSDEEAGDDDKKPAAITKAGAKGPTGKKTSDLDLDDEFDDDDDGYINSLVANGTIPSAPSASLPSTRGCSATKRAAQWGLCRSANKKKRKYRKETSASPLMKGSSKTAKRKPQPVPKTRSDAMNMLHGKGKVIKGLSTQLAASKRDTALCDRLLHLAGDVADENHKAYPWEKLENFGMRLYRRIRPELMFDDKDCLNWDDIYSVGGLLESLSGMRWDEMEAIINAEKQAEEQAEEEDGST